MASCLVESAWNAERPSVCIEDFSERVLCPSFQASPTVLLSLPSASEKRRRRIAQPWKPASPSKPPPKKVVATELAFNVWSTQNSAIQVLPPDVLAFLFSFLPWRELVRSAACVCRQWRQTACDPLLWRNNGFVMPDSNATPSMLTSLSAWPVRSLRLQPHLRINDSLERVAASCLRLRFLDLSFCSLDDSGLRHIAEHCTGIEWLNLSHCLQISDYGLMLLAVSLPKLHTLNLSWATGITDGGLVDLGVRAPLRSLSLVCCDKITDAGLISLAESCSKLEQLSLSGCPGITDHGVAALALGCRKLRALNLTECGGVGDGALEAIGQSLRSLEELELSHCEGVTDDGLEHVARLHELRLLGLNGCSVSREAIELVGQGCPRMEYLYLEDCEGVAGDALEFVNPECSIIWG